MQRKRFYYLLKIQYLGYRFHGWQQQPDVKTVEQALKRVISYVLDRRKFKLVSTGRTDAKVSVEQSFIELILDGEDIDPEGFFEKLNNNLPDDIRALDIEETDAHFNIIKDAKQKEYCYFFSFGEKPHPFCAPLMVSYTQKLDLAQMKMAARLFEGEHDFWSYAFHPTPKTKTTGKIDYCRIEKNERYTANFFPEKTYVLRICGAGFKRHQVRLIMGALFDLGMGRLDLSFIKQSLNPLFKIKMTHVAQASGLILTEVKFD
jgi:tRNA pseudouridine38-40 synthase